MAFYQEKQIIKQIRANPSDPRHPCAEKRMFTTALNDTLTVSYTHNGITLTETATVGINVKTIEVDVAVMTINGVPCATLQRVAEDMKAAQERCAQVNVKVVWKQLPDFPAPQSVINQGVTDWVVYNWNPLVMKSFLTAEAKAIIDASGLTGTERLRIIYVPGLKDDQGQVLAGYAISSAFKHNGVDDDYIDTCFVIASDRTNYIPAHEALHLLKEEHRLQRWNLMYEAVPKNYLWKDPRAIKRLDSFQQTSLYWHKRLGGTEE